MFMSFSQRIMTEVRIGGSPCFHLPLQAQERIVLFGTLSVKRRLAIRSEHYRSRHVRRNIVRRLLGRWGVLRISAAYQTEEQEQKDNQNQAQGEMFHRLESFTFLSRCRKFLCLPGPSALLLAK